jgi:hypothetical protein
MTKVALFRKHIPGYDKLSPVDAGEEKSSIVGRDSDSPTTGKKAGRIRIVNWLVKNGVSSVTHSAMTRLPVPNPTSLLERRFANIGRPDRGFPPRLGLRLRYRKITRE